MRMRLIVPLLATRQLATLVLLVVALTASLAGTGTGVGGSSSASASTETTAALHASEASDCADRAPGPSERRTQAGSLHRPRF
jgi:hypothetical protein